MSGATASRPSRPGGTCAPNCPCASCIEERAKPPDPFRVLTPQEASAGPPQPVAMKPIGHYAYQITWNDGHSTGIYPVSLLRELGSAAIG